MLETPERQTLDHAERSHETLETLTAHETSASTVESATTSTIAILHFAFPTMWLSASNAFLWAAVVSHAAVMGLNTDCETDSDCPVGTACVGIRTHSFNPTQVQAKCTEKTATVGVCRGSNAGKCPSYNAPSAPGGELETQCVFVNTTRLRNINCCGSDWTTPVVHRRLDNDTTWANTTTVNTPRDSADCFQCYKDTTSKKGKIIYAGQFFCVPQVECTSHSGFPFACQSNNLCFSNPGELCNNHGTCYPKDINDPKTSYGCLCNTGFSGEQCEKVSSSRCVVDCGDGNTKGSCDKGMCVCNKGWTGLQCEKCTTDDVCGTGTCDPVAGVCSCPVSSLFETQLIANVCYELGAKAVVDKTACANVTCGTKGFCTAGKCYCSTGCVGTKCPPCQDKTCGTCSGALPTAPQAWLLIAAALFTWTAVA
ncbi:unnamed protein product [Aphanomyces euteiches]